MNNNQFQIMYEQYKVGLFRYILSITHDPSLAEDILQDTFVQFIVSETSIERGKEQAWLYKVARNKCFNVLKRNKRELEFIESISNSNQQEWKFFNLISSLTAKEQEIVTLKIVGGFSHKKIARIIGSTIFATKKRYERAIKKLRDEMEA